MTAYQAAILTGSYVVGGIPISYLAARVFLGVDLRMAGTGTATPTNLRRVGGARIALIAGTAEVAKGAIGPALVGTGHLVLAAVAGAVAIAGHNWSPFLRGGGGRGISPATGALWIVAWPGAVYLGGWLLGGILAGRLAPVTQDRPGGIQAGRLAPSGPTLRSHPVDPPARSRRRTLRSHPDEPPARSRRSTLRSHPVDPPARSRRPPLRSHPDEPPARSRPAAVPPPRSWMPRPDRVLAAMRLGLFTLLPFLAVVRGLQGLLVGLILLTPIGFKTVHEISRRRLLPRTGRRA